MVSSFGENELSVSSRIIGRVRLLDVFAVSALFPRLMFRFGITLHESSKDFFAPNRPIQGFEIRDLRGEVKLDEHQNVVGSLVWIGPRRFVRSTSYGSENHVETVCDLDRGRLEKLEQHRAGREPMLWLALWPTLVDAHGFLDCDLQPIRAAIPRDKWVSILDTLIDTKSALLEITYPTLESPEFEAAVGHIRDARSRVNRGDFDEAIAACRRAIESFFNAVNIGHKANELEQILASITDDSRGKAYAGIVSRLKELGNVSVHRSEASGRFTRAEALFVVGAVEQTFALLASLLSQRKSR